MQVTTGALISTRQCTKSVGDRAPPGPATGAYTYSAPPKPLTGFKGWSRDKGKGEGENRRGRTEERGGGGKNAGRGGREEKGKGR